MPRIDPQQLLKTLGILLSPCGGIKSSEEVDRLVKLMSKFSRKLVSKCIYVQILQATDFDLLGHFLTEGGWTLLNSWFDDAIKGQNWPLVKEMCVLFMKCPMSAQLLKENVDEHPAPKLINQIRAVPSIRLDIRSLASELYRSWVDIVSQESKKETINVIVTDQTQQNQDGPVSLLQSLADEVSENLKKESSETVEDDDYSPLKSRKVPTVIKPKSTIMDGSIKINKKNLPSTIKKDKVKEKEKEKVKENKDKDKEDKKDKDKEREKEKEREKRKRQENREKERSKRFRPDGPGHRDEVAPEEKQRIKDMARKMKEEAQAKKEKDAKKPMQKISSLPKLPKIPKKPVDQQNKNPLSFEAMLGGLDSKPKTVKTPMIKNKTAALLEGMKSPSSSSKSSSSSRDSSKSSLKRQDSSSSSLSKKSSDHHHSSHHSSSSSSKSSSSSSSSSSSKSEKKLSALTIPSAEAVTSKKSESPKAAKSPSNKFSESSSFMDDLFSSMGVPTRKKKRRLSESKESGKSQSSPQDAKKVKVSETTTENNTPTTNTATTSPVTTPTTENSSSTIAFSFYKDTQLEPKEEVKDEQNDVTNEKVEDEKVEDNNKVIEEKSSPKEEIKDEMPFAEPDSMPREVKGILVYHRGREKREKRIKWRPDSNLVEVEYFEVDETERVNVNKLKFENLREFESKMEKAALKSKGSISDEENNIVLLPWYKPIPIKVTNRDEFTPGKESKEKEIQDSREKNVLSVIYFSKEMTPDTPKEAEPDNNSNSNLPIFKDIPLEDKEADENSEFQYGSKGWPTPKENQVSQQAQIESQLSQFSLPPALSSLLSTINKDGFEGIIPPVNTLKQMTKEEQDTLAAQTQAMKAMGILPKVPNFTNTMGNSNNGSSMPPISNPPPDFNRFPPPNASGSNNGYPVPPPFGGAQNNGPPNNGFYNQPPPQFSGQHRNGGRGDYRGHGDHRNGRGDYRGGRGGYQHRDYR